MSIIHSRPHKSRPAWRTVRYFGSCASAILVTAPAVAQQATIVPLKSAEMNFTGLQYKDYELSEALPIAAIGEDFCIDLAHFSAALEFPITVDVVTGRAKGYFFDSSRTIDLDSAAKTITLSGKTMALPENAVVPIDNGLCVSIAALGKWMPLSFSYDPRGSLLLLDSKESLPFEARQEREARQEQLSDAQEEIRASYEDAPKPDYALINVPAFVLSGYGGYARAEGKNAYSSGYSVAAVGELLKMTTEAVLVSDNRLVPSSLRATLYRQDPYGNVFGVPQLSEVMIGDVIGTGSNLLQGTGNGRGITLSSYPVGDSDEYDKTSFQGNLPPGWQAELYRNDILLVFTGSNASGEYFFKDVPVVFGKNDFKVVLYGPQGQREESRRSINASGFVVPKGKVYGRFSLVQRDTSLIEFSNKLGRAAERPLQFGGDFKIGISNNISGGAGFSSFVKDQKRYWYGSLSGQANFGDVKTDLSIATGSTGGIATQAAVQIPFSNGGVRLRYAEIGEKFSTERFLTGTKRAIDAGIDYSFKFGNGRSIPLSLNSQWNSRYDGSSNLAVTAQTGISLANGSLSNITRFTKNYAAPNSGAVAGPSAIQGTVYYNTQIGSYTVRGGANYTVTPSVSLQTLSVATEKSFAGGENPWNLSGALNWVVPSKSGDLSLSLNRIFRKFTASIGGSATTDGAFGVNFGFTMALGRDAAEDNWRVSGRNLAQAGSAVIRVFDDQNSDGVFNKEETLLRNAMITVDGNPAEAITSKKGLALVENLPPYRPVNIGVLSDQMDNADMLPAKLINGLSSRPGTTSYLDLPMIVAGGIDGEVLIETGVGPAQAFPGIEVQLMKTDGSVMTTAKAGYDGFFIFEKIPEGEYTLTIDADFLKRVNLYIASPRTIRITRANPYPSGMGLRLRRLSIPVFADNAVYEDRLISKSGEFSRYAAKRLALSRSFNNSISVSATAMGATQLADLKPSLKTPPHIETLKALFGDEVMNLPLAPPEPPARKLPTPTIVVINPRFDETFATQSKRAVAVSAPIS
jgi:hypothetical protein